MNKIKILIVNGGIMDRGGISSFINNYYSLFDRKSFDIDIVQHTSNDHFTVVEYNLLKCEIYSVISKSCNYRKWKKQMVRILSNKKYDIIHANADCGNGPLLKLAKNHGIKVRISHSHNTDYLSISKLRILLNIYQKRMINRYATICLACSSMAGEWLYGNRVDFTIIYNAINCEKYHFNDRERKKTRKEMKIDNKIVVGHVGRFDYQKNHEFILRISEGVNEKFVFLLIGKGHLYANIENEIKKNKITNIILLGETENIPKYLNAMDIFILPSKFEGLGMSAVEAQTNGLTCLLSNEVPIESKISDKAYYLPLNEKIWINKLKSFKEDPIRTSNYSLNYDIKIQSKKMQNIFEKAVKEEV